MIKATFKKGDWFKLNDAFFKVDEFEEDKCLDAEFVYMYLMKYENGNFVAGGRYQFPVTFVHSYMKPYTSPEQERENK